MFLGGGVMGPGAGWPAPLCLERNAQFLPEPSEFDKQINTRQDGALLEWQPDYWGDVGLKTENPGAVGLEK